MSRSLKVACLLGCVSAVIALPSVAQRPAPMPPPIPAPVDRPFKGEIDLSVDATDLERRIVHVHETITGLTSSTVLLYPKWLPGDHAPEGPIDRLAGLQVSVAGTPIPWTRDTVEVYAFRLHLPPGARSVDLAFDYLSPTSSRVGPVEITPDLLMLEWNEVLLYPAGYYVSRIPVKATLAIPEGWKLATALEPAGPEGATTQFQEVPLETLVDSPVFAGRYMERINLDAATQVNLNVFADRPDLLQASPKVIALHRALVQQAYKLYGSHHYSHYDFLFALSDQLAGVGLEHHQSSEDTTDPNYFVDWDGTPAGRDLLAHEYTHSWNGKFRRPADLWTPDYEVPMRDSLLWVYEGLTQYWGLVLTARSGMWSRAQALDGWAQVAAAYGTMPGRQWRPLQDTTNDEIINPRRPLGWRSFQRFEDYYDEGALIWLEADTLIRERSDGQRSLDDFARRFVGIDNGQWNTVTYTFDDIVKTLNEVEPYDWAHFLREHLDSVGHAAPQDWLDRSGYRIVYTDKESDYEKAAESRRKTTSLQYSIGCSIGGGGNIGNVIWGSPAFKAGLTEGTQILAINGVGYSGDLLKRTIEYDKGKNIPMALILKKADRYFTTNLTYSGGLRYPHLQRDPSVPARLDAILSPR